MPQFSLKADFPNIDVKGYKREIKKIINQEMRKAAIAFLKAAYKHVPMWTGMSRGSFLDLAKFLNVSLNINPRKVRYYYRTRTLKNGKQKKYKTKIDITKERYYIRSSKGKKTGKWIPKNPESGRKLSRFELKMINDRVNFLFHSKVYQYNLGDFLVIDNSITSPWKSMEEGLKAFQNVISKLPRKIQQLQKVKTRTHISVGYGSAGLHKYITPETSSQNLKEVKKTWGK